MGYEQHDRGQERREILVVSGRERTPLGAQHGGVWPRAECARRWLRDCAARDGHFRAGPVRGDARVVVDPGFPPENLRRAPPRLSPPQPAPAPSARKAQQADADQQRREILVVSGRHCHGGIADNGLVASSRASKVVARVRGGQRVRPCAQHGDRMRHGSVRPLAPLHLCAWRWALAPRARVHCAPGGMLPDNDLPHVPGSIQLWRQLRHTCQPGLRATPGGHGHDEDRPR